MNRNAIKISGIAVGLLMAGAALAYLANSGAGARWYVVFSEKFDGATETALRLVEGDGPLRGGGENSTASAATQTVAGVVAETNKHRATEGLPPLRVNSRLSASAQVKLNDMFARQYFEHEAPTGEGPSTLIKAQGYEYLLVAENLALGNYENDIVLVQAWMDSPGHRANIMNGAFGEIGVAVGKGTFEGQTVWMAVQHFGRPVSSCPAPDAQLKAAIDSRQRELDRMLSEIDSRQRELEVLEAQNDPSYYGKAGDYNTLVEQYNALREDVRAQLVIYNEGVAVFNACATIQ